MAEEEREEPEATTVADNAPEEVKESSPPSPPAAPSDGVKMSGTVNWFNVAKGFGAFQCRVSFVSLLIEIDAPRARAYRRPPRRESTRTRGKRASRILSRHRRASSTFPRARARSSRRSARSTSPRKPATPASFVFLTRPVRYPRLRVHHARRRSGRHLRAPVGHLLRGVPELTRRRARGVHAPGDRRRAIQSRARESSPRVKYSYPESVFFLRSARSPASRALVSPLPDASRLPSPVRRSPARTARSSRVRCRGTRIGSECRTARTRAAACPAPAA